MRLRFLAFLSALFFAGCATTPKAEYQTGDCLKVAASELAKIPPQARMMVQLLGLKVVDRGEEYYVVEVSMMNEVQGVNAVKFEQAEKETDKALCPGQEDKGLQDMLDSEE